MRVAYVLTQSGFGPADVAVSLTRWMAREPDVSVRLFSPVPDKGADQIADHHEAIEVPKKTDVPGMRRAVKAITDWQPDVIHAQDRRSGLLIAAARRPWARSPALVGTYHGAPENVPNEWAVTGHGPRPGLYPSAVMAGDAVVGRLLDATVVVAEQMAGLVRRLGAPADRVHHIDNGLWLPEADSIVPPDAVCSFLFVGALIERKGLFDLIEAFARVQASHPSARLTLAGKGPLEDELRQVVAQRGLAGVVTFAGFATDVSSVLATHDCLVLPSHLEQQPLVIIEALGAGRPVIATAVGGVPGMLEGLDQGARLVPPHDPPALADALIDVLESTEDLAAVSAGNRARAEQRYSVDVLGSRHLSLYRRLLEQRTA